MGAILKSKMRKFALMAFFSITCIFLTFNAYADELRITGNVKEEHTQEPLIGATVSVKGTTIGTATDVNGNYLINVPSSESVLVFSYLGFITQEITVGNQSIINIALREDTSIFDEVVVIGFGTTSKKEVTGSVASLKSDDLNQGTFTNAMGLLQGKVAGLQITNPNGADPAASFQILLRGTNTLRAGQGPLIIVDGVANADIRNINFQEVESIDVLKDGSAAAIYGARGTNGVIIITTKRARPGVTQVEYFSHITAQSIANRAIPLTAEEYRHVINTYAPGLVSNIYDDTTETDWFKEITRVPISHKHSLSVSGGTELFSHRTVLNVEQNQGLQINNQVDKYLFRTNIKQKALEGWLDLDYNAFLSKREVLPANYSAFSQAFSNNPTTPVYDPNNTESGGYYRNTVMEYFNPVAMIKERNIENTTDNMGLNTRATLNILPIEGLKWDNFLSYGQERYESRQYYTKYYPSEIGKDGVASISNFYYKDIQYESTVRYMNQIEEHSFQTILGYTYQKGISQESSMGNFGFDTDDFLTNNIGVGTAIQDGVAEMFSYKSSNTYIAFFGRLIYNYDERYLLSASLRRDGSSRFGIDNKWGWFPAISLGWRISQESFLNDLDWVNELKLRAGYGVTGNQDFSNYQSLLRLGVAGKFFYNGKWVNTYQPVSNANPNLGWENKTELNLGIDFSLFKNRLSGFIDYYSRRTTDLLYTYTVPSPPYLYTSLFTNVGEISNKGIEITLLGVPVKGQNFEWNSSLTFSRNTNKLISFTNEEFTDGVYKVGWISGAVTAYSQRLVEGQSLGTFYGPVWLGVDADGEDILKGQNAIGLVPEDEWEVIGTAYPDFVIGWSNSLRYKNWDLNFSLRASIGGNVLNNYRLEYENLARLGLRNIQSSWLDNTNFTGSVKYSSKYVEDATYLKLDNITIGYNFNFSSNYVTNLRPYISAQNLLCITGYKGVDPEVGMMGLSPGIEAMSYYPRTTLLTFGLNLTF